MKDTNTLTVNGKDYTRRELCNGACSAGAIPSELFWTLWRESKDQLKSQGVVVTKVSFRYIVEFRDSDWSERAEETRRATDELVEEIRERGNQN